MNSLRRSSSRCTSSLVFRRLPKNTKELETSSKQIVAILDANDNYFSIAIIILRVTENEIDNYFCIDRV